MRSTPSRRASRFGVPRGAGRASGSAAEAAQGGADTTVSASQSIVACSPSTILNDGVAVTTITVTICNAAGVPLSGKAVTLAATGSNNTLVQPSSVTNGSGQTTGTLASTTAEAKTITATSEAIAITDTAVATFAASADLFASDWSTATGQTEAALGDGGTWGSIAGFPDNTALTLNVVANASAPAPFTRTTNLLRITQRGSLYNGTLIAADALPEGVSTYGELFVLNGGNTSTNNHPLTYNLIGGFQAIPFMLNATATDWAPGVRIHDAVDPVNSAYPQTQWGPGVQGGALARLAHDTWYRYRWHIDFYDVGNPLRYRIYPYVYAYDDENPTTLGSALYTASTFFIQDYAGTAGGNLQAYYDGGGYFLMDNLTEARTVAFGQEGSGGATDTGAHFYIGDFRIRSGGWVD